MNQSIIQIAGSAGGTRTYTNSYEKENHFCLYTKNILQIQMKQRREIGTSFIFNK